MLHMSLTLARSVAVDLANAGGGSRLLGLKLKKESGFHVSISRSHVKDLPTGLFAS